MRRLVTPQGWEFNSVSYVQVGDKWVDVDELSAEQRERMATELNVRGLNAGYAGKATFRAVEK